MRRSTRIADRGKKLDYAEYPRYDPPGDWSQPYGRGEGVAIAQSRIPGAGNGLYGVKPRTHNSMLFKEAGEFVCVYATEADIISCGEAQPLTPTAYGQIVGNCMWIGIQKHYTLIQQPAGITANSSMNTGRRMKTVVKFGGTMKP